ncbi:MAG: CHRD domain-containing protein [Pseudomonadota bacterium]
MNKIGLFSLVLSALFCTSIAQAYPIAFSAHLAPEVVGATGTGSVMLEFDAAAHTLSIDASWAGLSGTTTVAHIHCCTAVPGIGTIGVAVTPSTLPGFPVGTQGGSYSIDLDLTLLATYTGGFLNNFGGGTVAGAEAALLAGLKSGSAYFNVHTTTFAGGEIRGFPTAVPEPMSLALFAMALLGLFIVQRKKAV